MNTPMPAADSLNQRTEYETSAARAFSDKRPETQMGSLGQEFLAEFSKAEMDRNTTELRWLKDMRQYKGQYEPEEIAAIGPTRSQSYVRKTRVKVKTVDSRVADLLFPAGNDKNWDISPTPVPTVSEDVRQEAIKALKQAAQQMMAPAAQPAPQGGPPAAAPPDGSDPNAGAQGAGSDAAASQMSPEMQQQAMQMAAQQQAQPQAPAEPTDEQIDAWIDMQTKKAAKGMSKKIDDQLVEARYKQQAMKVLHSGHLYGTGILKGPLVELRIRTRFERQGNDWVPVSESYLIPFLDFVPLWRFYPDMNATELDECRFIYERHTLTRLSFFALTKNKSFNKKLIVDHLEANPDGLAKVRYYDADLKSIGDRDAKQGDMTGQYEVLERWGYIEGYKLADAGFDVPEERRQEAVFANIWMLPNGVVIKAVLQPINGVTWPYHLYHFDKDETSIFGEGLATIMRDDQKMINAATRMMIDNAAITSGPMLEIALGLLSSTDQATAAAPWKTYLRNSQSPGAPAVRAIEIPNHVEWLAAMGDRFDKNADEVTAVPRYMTGENATSGAAGTSSGLSMLMGAVNIVIKDLISGYDEGVTVPFLQALYRWNMQFCSDHEIKGDFDVYARGTASLVAKEVRSQQLNNFASLVANPMDAPFIKRLELNQQRAEALEMSNVVKTEDEVKADQKDPMFQQQQQLQMQLQAAQLAEAQAKSSKLLAEAQAAQARAQESQAKAQDYIKRLETMALDMEKTKSEIENINSKTIENKVASVFAALQAGGVATERPVIAPAGDEILKSAGFVDKTPNPSIASLNGPPVQNEQGTEQVLNKGQSFAQEPRGADASELGPEQGPVNRTTPDGQPLPTDGADAGDNRPDVAAPQQAPALHPSDPSPQPATGQVGLHAGIETDRIEPA